MSNRPARKRLAEAYRSRTYKRPFDRPLVLKTIEQYFHPFSFNCIYLAISVNIHIFLYLTLPQLAPIFAIEVGNKVGKIEGAMAQIKREKTKYPGVFYRMVERKGKTGEERVYYIVFKKDGKGIEEKVGRQYADNMTEAKASGIRAERIEGKRLSRKEVRTQKAREQARPVISKLWDMYLEGKPKSKNLGIDDGRFKNYLKHPFGNKLPTEISTNDIRNLRNSLLKKQSPQSVLNTLALLRRIIRFGVKNGLCDMPDASQLYFEMPKVDNLKTEALTPQQIEKFKQALDAEPNQNTAALIRLALATGMRRGALLALKWSDFDFQSGFITLRGDVAKKGRTERIPLSVAAREILQKVERTESPYVFPGKNGQQRKEFSRIARRVRDAADLPKDFRPLHGLRHAYASFLASSGQVDLYTLQKLLTHESPQMTQRYAHLADEALHRAASVADNIFTEREDDGT